MDGIINGISLDAPLVVGKCYTFAGFKNDITIDCHFQTGFRVNLPAGSGVEIKVVEDKESNGLGEFTFLKWEVVDSWVNKEMNR